MKVARCSNVPMSEVRDDMCGRLIFIDDQSSGDPTTALLQSLQTEDSSIGAGKLPMIAKSVFVNPDILAMISGGIKRMNGLWLRFTFRLSSYCFILSLAMAFSRFATSTQNLQGEPLEHEMLPSMPCRSSMITSE